MYSSQILQTYGGSKTIYDYVDPGWEAPSRDQVQELFGNCTAAKSTRDGVSGVHLTSKSNGRSIFIPNGTYYTRTKTGTETHTTSSIYGLGGYHWDYYVFTIAEGKCSWGSQCGQNTSYVRLVLL